MDKEINIPLEKIPFIGKFFDPNRPKKPKRKSWEDVQLESEFYTSKTGHQCVQHILKLGKVKRQWNFIAGDDHSFFVNVKRYKKELYEAARGRLEDEE